VFGQVGVARATVDEIAERAGVSKGTIYLYFPNKEELFRQSIREALESESPRPATAVNAPSTSQLYDTLARYWHFLSSPMALVVNRLVQSEQWQFPELTGLYATGVLTPLEEELEEIIGKGIRNGDFREMDPRVAARMLTAVTVQSANRAAGGTLAVAGKSGDEVFGEITEFCLQAMVPADAAFAQADGAPALRGALNN